MATFPAINPLAAILTSRNISAEEAVALEMVDQDAEDINVLTGGKLPSWLKGTMLPYHDLDGSLLTLEDKRLFCRWRLAMKNGNPLPENQNKYHQPSKSGVAAYLPTLYGINWVEVAHDPSFDLWITEGEFKAISATQNGLLCIGLGGVDNWRDKAGRIARPFDKFVLAKRKIYVCYDADAESTAVHPYKPSVESAFQRFTAYLCEQGAIVYRISISKTAVFEAARRVDPHCKMGIDDYIVAGGTTQDLANTSEQIQHNKEASRLLREYAIYQGKKAHIVRVADGVPFTSAEFSTLIEAHAITEKWDQNSKVPKRIKVKEHEAWRESKNHLKIDRYVFAPDSDPGYNHTDRTYNIWKGWAVKGYVGDGEGELYKQTIADWKKFIGGLFGEWAGLFEQWLAHMVQFPAVKTSMAVLICTKLNGVGKSLLGEMIIDLIGGGEDGHAVALELDRVVGTNFNAQMRAKLFVQIDEADGRFSGHESKLKDLITSDMLPIELKGMDTVLVKNYVRVFLTSNSVVPIRMDGQNRRILVIRPEMTQEFATTVWEPWVSKAIGGGIRKSEHGLRMLRWHLDRVDLTGWDPQARVPVTEAMLDLVESSVTKKAETSDRLVEVLHEDEHGFWALTGELRAKDKMLWGEVIASLRLSGGRTCTHVLKIGGKPVKVTILDPHGKLPIKKVGDQYALSNAEAQLTGEQVQTACARASTAYDKWKSNVMGGSDKF